MQLNVYLSGEIHSNWREEIIEGCKKLDLAIEFLTPVTAHEASDDIGTVLGKEADKFWYDHKSAKINTMRIKNGIKKADVVIIKFGDKYRQWNAAFDAGQAAAMGKSYIVIHPEEYNHALKEVDAQAMAVATSTKQIIDILTYLCTQK